MARVLLTGISGFIGSELALKLVEKGHEVYGVVRRVASRNLGTFESIFKDIVLITGDVSDYVSIRNALKTAKPDCVIHLAAISPVRDSFERPFEYQQTNFLGTLGIAHAMLELPDPQTRRIIAASTAEVYGLQENKPLGEEATLKPSSPYAVSKAAADLYLQMMFQTYGLKGTIMRPVNSYGRKMDKSFMIEYLVTQMLNGGRVTVGAPASFRDYMYVDDHVNAYLLAMEKEEAIGQVFNISTGILTENEKLAETIADKVGYDKSKIVFGSYPFGYPLRPLVSDQPYIVLDSRKIQRRLNWKPTVTLDEGLDKVISYFRSQ